ncbi:MAG: hypothetical protein PVI75_01370 [Gammaproteobacteria bacterium]|jgi:hypothetical protein
MAFGKKLVSLLNKGIKYIKNVFAKYFRYKTFKETTKYLDKGIINGAADSALMLFVVDDWFGKPITKVSKTTAYTLFSLWMAGCIAVRLINLLFNDVAKATKGNAKLTFSMLKLLTKPIEDFINGFNIVAVPAFLFFEVFDFAALFSNQGYLACQIGTMVLSGIFGAHDAQQSFRKELQNVDKAMKQKKGRIENSHSKIKGYLDKLDKFEKHKIINLCKLLFIKGPQVILINYLNFTALNFYLSFVRKVYPPQLPFTKGSKTTVPFILTTAGIIPQALQAILNCSVDQYKNAQINEGDEVKNLAWKKFISANSRCLNVFYDVLSRYGMATVIFLVIKHTIETIKNISYDNTFITELLTGCIAALSMFHELIDSGRSNFKAYKNDLKEITNPSRRINLVQNDSGEDKNNEEQPLIINPVQSITSQLK